MTNSTITNANAPSTGSRVTEVAIERLPHGADLPLPSYQTAGAAGVDLLAAIPQRIELAVGARCMVPTGVRVAIPRDLEGQVRPRSGLAVRHGLTVLNTPGTIDSDYRGEIGVCLINCGQMPVQIERGMRIAQLVFAPVRRVAWRTDVALDATDRGQGGFGSTGEGIDRGECIEEPRQGRLDEGQA